MIGILRKTAFAILMVFLAAGLFASGGREKDKTDSGQSTAPQIIPAPPAEQPGLPLDSEIPLDPAVKIGLLPNGLTYYIRQNGKPEGRAELRLVVNAGSILEDEDQKGLAHFVEHMAFNGTENFSKNEIINYLESIGMAFGPEINAYTSFDETVYMLHVPTDNPEVFEKAFLILKDWASALTFDPEEVEKERGVVIEEWRLGRGAEARMLDKQIPVLFKDSQYAARLPIGDKAVLDSFPAQAAVRFYREWYRPELMALVAVGDFDSAEVERLISKYFEPLTNGPGRERKVYEVPFHSETLVAMASDPEAPYSVVSFYFKREPFRPKTGADYRRALKTALISLMFNDRLSERTDEADPPYAAAYAGYSPLVRTKDVFVVQALASGKGIEEACYAMAEEVFDAKGAGFSAEELERAKKRLLSTLTQAFRERNKTESAYYAGEYSRHFLMDNIIPSIEYELSMAEKLLPAISAEEVNLLIRELALERNLAVLIDLPEKAAADIPGGEVFSGLIKKARAAGPRGRAEETVRDSLLREEPRPGKVTAKKALAGINASEYTLSNGARVIFKNTDFQDDEILFFSFTWGGLSKIDDSAYVSALMASDFVIQSGGGDFSRVELERTLAGRQVSLYPYMDRTVHGFTGFSNNEDFETLLSLMWLYGREYKIDQAAYSSLLGRLSAVLENQMGNPEVIFSHTLQRRMYGNHFRAQPLTPELLKQAELKKALDSYSALFSDYGDSTFFIVGSVTEEQVLPLIEKYIASLPAAGAKGSVTDRGLRFSGAGVSEVVRAGLERKSAVTMIFGGPVKWSARDRFLLESLADLLRIRLREVLREDEGGTYGVGVYSRVSRIPVGEYLFQISFNCDPQRVEELTALVHRELEEFKKGSLGEEYLVKVREGQLRSRERDIKTNQFWISAFQDLYSNNLDPTSIQSFEDTVRSLTLEDLRTAAAVYLPSQNLLSLYLFPGAE